MSRQSEITQVDETHRHVWLAGQLDEVEQKFVDAVAGLSSSLQKLTKELELERAQRKEQGETDAHEREKARTQANLRTIGMMLTIITVLVTLLANNVFT